MTLVPSVYNIPSEHNSVKINPYECAVFTHDEKYHQSHDITDIVIVFLLSYRGVHDYLVLTNFAPEFSFSRSGQERF